MTGWDVHCSLSCVVLLFFLCYGFPVLFRAVRLYKCTSIYWGFFFLPLNPAPQHHSPSEPLLCHIPRVLFQHPLGLIAPFAFYSSFDTLWVLLLCMLSLPPQMKAAISAPCGDRKRNNFLLVSSACKAVVSFPTFSVVLKQTRGGLSCWGSLGWKSPRYELWCGEIIQKYLRTVSVKSFKLLLELWSFIFTIFSSLIWVCSFTNTALMLLNTLVKMKVVWWRAVHTLRTCSYGN